MTPDDDPAAAGRSGNGGQPGRGGQPGQAGGFADQAARLLQTLVEFSAAPGTGHAGAQCPIFPVCPICRAVAALRQVRPEAVEHLVSAAAEFAAAVREVAVGSAGASSDGADPSAAAAPSGRPRQASGDRRPGGPAVQPIPVTD